MKIDFLSTYRSLNSVIHAPQRPQPGSSGAPEFEKTLQSVSPDSLQDTDFITERLDNGKLPRLSVQPEQQPMASLKLLEPKLNFGSSERLVPTEILPDGVKDVRPSVKTPALITARRVTEEGSSNAGPAAVEEPRASLQPSSLIPPNQDEEFAKVSDFIRSAGQRHGVDPSLGLAVASAESSFDPRAVSSDGHASKGIFQLLDSTGKDLLERSGEKGDYEPFNPELNVNLGVGYLRYLHDLFSKESDLPNNLKTVGAANSSSLEKLAVAAFNAGEGRVASAQKRAEQAGKDPSEYDQVEPYLPENTREYVRKVIREKRLFEGQGIGQT